MSARAAMKRDGTASRLERQDSIISGRQSGLGATKTLHEMNSTIPQPPDNASHRHTQLAADTRHSNLTSQSVQRPPTASGRRRRALRHNVTDSYVDESLFGPVTDDTSATAPWQPKQRPVKPFIFDCTDYKAKAANMNSSSNMPSSRPSSHRSVRSRPNSARLHSEPSFVDESLFGDQLELSTWRAPWEKKDRGPKPLIFDATNYREKQQRANTSDARVQRVASAKQRPPWR